MIGMAQTISIYPAVTCYRSASANLSHIWRGPYESIPPGRLSIRSRQLLARVALECAREKGGPWGGGGEERDGGHEPFQFQEQTINGCDTRINLVTNLKCQHLSTPLWNEKGKRVRGRGVGGRIFCSLFRRNRRTHFEGTDPAWLG